MTIGAQVKGCFASIKSAIATLDGLAEKTQHEQAKTAYEDAGILLREVREDLNKQVLYLMREEPQYKQ